MKKILFLLLSLFWIFWFGFTNDLDFTWGINTHTWQLLESLEITNIIENKIETVIKKYPPNWKNNLNQLLENIDKEISPIVSWSNLWRKFIFNSLWWFKNDQILNWIWKNYYSLISKYCKQIDLGSWYATILNKEVKYYRNLKVDCWKYSKDFLKYQKFSENFLIKILTAYKISDQYGTLILQMENNGDVFTDTWINYLLESDKKIYRILDLVINLLEKKPSNYKINFLIYNFSILRDKLLIQDFILKYSISKDIWDLQEWKKIRDIADEWVSKSRIFWVISDLWTIDRLLLTYRADYQSNPSWILPTIENLSDISELKEKIKWDSKSILENIIKWKKYYYQSYWTKDYILVAELEWENNWNFNANSMQDLESKIKWKSLNEINSLIKENSWKYYIKLSLTNNSLYNVNSPSIKARNISRLANINQISTALEVYHSDNWIYPVLDFNTINSLSKYLVSKYIKNLPNDLENGRNYYYMSLNSWMNYVLITQLEWENNWNFNVDNMEHLEKILKWKPLIEIKNKLKEKSWNYYLFISYYEDNIDDINTKVIKTYNYDEIKEKLTVFMSKWKNYYSLADKAKNELDKKNALIVFKNAKNLLDSINQNWNYDKEKLINNIEILEPYLNKLWLKYN